MQLVVVDIDVDVDIGDAGNVCGVGDVQVNHIRCALVFVMKNEHWRGLASDGCNQLSRFHSRFHLRFQFELRGSAQSDPRRLKGPTNLFFKSFGKFLITVSNNSWKSKSSIF